jgi:hypothetical protein
MVTALLAVNACVDPGGRFEDFVHRLPDGAVVNKADAPPVTTVPDISGTFLFSIYVALFPGLAPIQAIATTTLKPATSGASPKLDIQIDFLNVDDRSLLGSGSITVKDVAVNGQTGEFTVMLDKLVIPAMANALHADATATNVSIPGSIKTANAWCGTVEGFVQPQNADLHGSTFGAIRVSAGQTGTQLPGPAVNCAQATAARDGGM